MKRDLENMLHGLKEIAFYSEHSGRVDKDILHIENIDFDENKVSGHWYYTTNSSGLARCPYCGQFYVTTKNCQCDQIDDPYEDFEMTIDEFIKFIEANIDHIELVY